MSTGALLGLYYRPEPDHAFDSLVTVTHTVKFGWLVRSLHRVAGHGLVLVSAVYVLRGFFRRVFLRPRGAAAWPIAVGMSFVLLALLLTGAALPWNQEAYWQTVVATNLVSEVPVAGPWLAEAVRGGMARPVSRHNARRARLPCLTRP